MEIPGLVRQNNRGLHSFTERVALPVGCVPSLAIFVAPDQQLAERHHSGPLGEQSA